MLDLDLRDDVKKAITVLNDIKNRLNRSEESYDLVEEELGSDLLCELEEALNKVSSAMHEPEYMHLWCK